MDQQTCSNMIMDQQTCSNMIMVNGMAIRCDEPVDPKIGNYFKCKRVDTGVVVALIGHCSIKCRKQHIELLKKMKNL
jgi:hypothetical protein